MFADILPLLGWFIVSSITAASLVHSSELICNLLKSLTTVNFSVYAYSSYICQLRQYIRFPHVDVESEE